jgi:hypothetical protein
MFDRIIMDVTAVDVEIPVVPLSFRDQSRANWGTTFPGGVALASKEAIPDMTRVHGLSTGDR